MRKDESFAVIRLFVPVFHTMSLQEMNIQHPLDVQGAIGMAPCTTTSINNMVIIYEDK